MSTTLAASLYQGLHEVVPQVKKPRLLLPSVWVGQDTLVLTISSVLIKGLCVYFFIVGDGEH